MLSQGDTRPMEELVFLHRGPVTLRTLVVVIGAIGSGIAGYKLFLLHQEYVLRIAAGAHLDSLKTFVAQSPTPVTVLVGWVAAVFFALALLRVRSGPLEPATSFRRAESLTVSQLRRAFRREYVLVRLLLVVVVLITAVELARAISFSVGAEHAGVSSTTSWTLYVEAAGFVVAAIVVIAYARAFGERIAHLGAI